MSPLTAAPLTKDPLLSTKPRGPQPPAGKKQKAAAPEPPEPPDLEVYVEEGDHVDWFPGGDLHEHPQTALVTQLQHDTKVALNVFHPQLGYTIPQDGAYHVSHRLAQIDNGSGAWRARPWTIAVRRLLLSCKVLMWNEAKDRLVLAPVQMATAPDPVEQAPPPK